MLQSKLCSQKNTKSDSKHSIAIVNKPSVIPFDLSADMTQIIYDLAYLVKGFIRQNSESA